MQGEVPSARRNWIAWLALLGLVVAGGLTLLAMRPVLAASASAAVEAQASPEPPRFVQLDLPPRVTWGLPPGTPATDPGPPAEPVAEIPPSLVVRVTRGAVKLHAGPGEAVVAEHGTVTEFGSPTALGVVELRDHWVAVVSPELANGQVGWIDVSAAGVELGSTELRISIDLSRRELVLRRGDAVLRRMTVGVGQPGSPTPVGRFAVTDKLAGADYSSVYGCCIIALSAHQPDPPPGWQGGNRIAIHGTNDPSTIGAATSAGCPHASDEDLRYLMKRVPLGTPVVVHP
jgi:lipoprotein-anchoring transpeptidase ErfK/SrfK